MNFANPQWPSIGSTETLSFVTYIYRKGRNLKSSTETFNNANEARNFAQNLPSAMWTTRKLRGVGLRVPSRCKKYEVSAATVERTWNEFLIPNNSGSGWKAVPQMVSNLPSPPLTIGNRGSYYNVFVITTDPFTQATRPTPHIQVSSFPTEAEALAYKTWLATYTKSEKRIWAIYTAKYESTPLFEFEETPRKVNDDESWWGDPLLFQPLTLNTSNTPVHEPKGIGLDVTDWFN